MPLSPPNLFSSVNSILFFISFNTTWYAAIRQSDGDIIEEDVTNISTSSLYNTIDSTTKTPLLLILLQQMLAMELLFYF